MYMPRVAKAIAEACEGRLTAVVATHRHADHISGFGTDTRTGKSGEVIRGLRPRLVIQPWTEDPKAKRDAKAATTNSVRSRKSFVAGLAAMQDVARMVFDLAERNPAWMGVELRRELRFLGEDNLRNASAVRNLIAMGEATGARPEWLNYGASSSLVRLLPGVKVSVLGPPNLKQSEKIRSMRSKDPDQFWHLIAGGPQLHDKNPLAEGLKQRGDKGRSSKVPREARWFRDRLDRMRGDQLLEIVRSLDQQMNNTSLILLFEVFGKKFLFPGDAQIENWSYALADAPDAKANRASLADVDVYKVGHHGSLNATPKQLLWKAFRKRSHKQLHTLLSTLPGKHGKTRNRTEVPRRPLLETLKSESQLLNTDDLSFSSEPQYHSIEVTAKGIRVLSKRPDQSGARRTGSKKKRAVKHRATRGQPAGTKPR
jgi:hypothetical protein